LNHYIIHKADGTGPTAIKLNGRVVPFKPSYFVTFKEFDENPRAQEFQLI